MVPTKLKSGGGGNASPPPSPNDLRPCAKTEVMLITPRRMATKIECPALAIGDHAVVPSPFARNLGIIFDSVATMERQINAVCKISYALIQHKQDSVLLGQTISRMHNPCICHL